MKKSFITSGPGFMLYPPLNGISLEVECWKPSEYRRILPDSLNPEPLYLRAETFMPFLRSLMLNDPLQIR